MAPTNNAHSATEPTSRNAADHIPVLVLRWQTRASLFRSTSPTSERALADAVLEGFWLTFALRQYDMSVDLYLRNVTLAMIEHGEIRKPLLSSAASDHAEGSTALPSETAQKISSSFACGISACKRTRQSHDQA